MRRTSVNDMTVEQKAALLSRQGAWSAPLRRHLYRKAGLARRGPVLDAGCGTGEVTAELAELTRGPVTGVDADAELIELASNRHPEVDFKVADCMGLPFGDGSFEAVTCHFLLMWLEDPPGGVREMVRVLKAGGVVLACAEPDYGGLVEYPEHRDFSRGVEAALKRAGADPMIGRKLGAIFRSAGLGVEHGVSATVWDGDLLRAEFGAREDVYRHDLESVMGRGTAAVLEREREQVETGKMVMVPLFWALGFKPPTG